MTTSDEIERRERAYANRGQVVEGSGVALKPRQLGHMVSLRLTGEQAGLVRDAAEASGVSLSEFIRHAALVHARRQVASVPAHACNGVGCRWCDPRELASLVVSGPFVQVLP